MSAWVRQLHRWLSIAFTLAVVVNIVCWARKVEAVWVGLTALFPLIVLSFTGLYLFALPYVTASRSSRRGGAG